MGAIGAQPNSLRPLLVVAFCCFVIIATCLQLPANASPTLHLQTALGGRLIIHDDQPHGGKNPDQPRLGRMATWSKEPAGVTHEPASHVAESEQVSVIPHETKTAILLTNGQQIKLYPLREADLIPSGGYYVIKSREQFDLSDSKVIESLERDSSTFARWLEYKRRLVVELRAQASNEPRSRRNHVVRDEDLYERNDNQSGWRRPLITHVGHMFDRRFCQGSSQGLHDNCLVVFWLDKRNNYLRYGSHQFTSTDRVQLLSSKFDANGTLRSLSDDNKKTIWLHEFPPVDLCKQIRDHKTSVVECRVESIAVNRRNRTLLVDVSRRDADERPSPKRIGPFASAIQPSGLEIRYHNIGPVSVIDHDYALEIIANDPSQFFWLRANNALWVQSTSRAEGLGTMSSKPAIRQPGQFHLHRDTLFFNDLAMRAIMSTNVTLRRQLRQREESYPEPPPPSTGRQKFDTVRRLSSTHQVLVVEPSKIESFNVVSLQGELQAPHCSRSETEASEPLVIDDDLSENITRQRVDSMGFGTGNLVLETMQLLPIVLLFILIIWFVATKRKHNVDKSQALARYDEIQT